MARQPRWRAEGGIGLLTAVVWLVWSRDANALGFTVAIIVSLWLGGSGFALVFSPGHRYITQQMSLGAVASFCLALVAGFASGPPLGMALVLGLSILDFAAAGHAGVAQEPRYADAPRPRGPSLGLKVAVDEALLGWFTLLARTPVAAEAERALEEVQAAERLWSLNGWTQSPLRFHAAPDLDTPVAVRRTPVGRWPVEELAMESGYAPWPGEPGAERWVARSANATLYARLLRHEGKPRPWLVCIHGYRMGTARGDVALARPRWLHQRLGLNLLLPVLPLHGPRRSGWLSGDGFLDGDPMDALHAEAQAVWDIRRLLLWLRECQGATSVGVLGYSLGAYTAALLAALEQDLDCVIAGIPASDLVALQWRHGSGPALRYMESLGLGMARVQRLFNVISPLALPCAVPRQRRFMFAATGDRLVPAEQVVRLWHHWQEPEIAWYQGGHLTFRSARSVSRMIEHALRKSGMVRG